jgi:thioredoxin-related protein
MTRPLRNALGLALLLLIAAAPSPAQAQAGAQEKQIQWLDWDTGMALAQRTGRPVLVDVYTDWCGWCKRMDRDVYANPEVREYLSSRFVTIKLDAEAPDPAHYEGRDHTSITLAERFKVTSYPMTIFLKSNGQHSINVPGYVPAEKFLTVLRYIGEGHLDRGVAWDAFNRKQANPPRPPGASNALRAR